MKKAGLFTIAGVAVVTLLGLVYLALTFDASQGGTTTVVIAPPVEPVRSQSPPSRAITPADNSILPKSGFSRRQTRSLHRRLSRSLNRCPQRLPVALSGGT